MVQAKLFWKCWGLVIFFLVSSTPVFGAYDNVAKNSDVAIEKSSWWSWMGFGRHKKSEMPKIASESAPLPQPIKPTEQLAAPAQTCPSDQADDNVQLPQAHVPQTHEKHEISSLMAQTPNKIAEQKFDATDNITSLKTTKPVVRQYYTDRKVCSVKKSCAPRNNTTCGSQNSGIYPLPNWPFYTQYFQENDLIQILFAFDTASQAYAGRGGNENLSKLIFGQSPITIKEILLASKLVNTGKISSSTAVFTSGVTPAAVLLGSPENIALTEANHFLSILADQEVKFDATLNQCVGALNCARSFRNGEVTIGFHIPLKIRNQRLHITNDISASNKEKLLTVQNGPGIPVDVAGTIVTPGNTAANASLHFYEQFTSLTDFVDEILDRKNLGFNRKQTILGFSDVTGYINVEIPSRYIDHMITGFSLLLPTATERDTEKLWYTDLGNGGFIETSAYLSLFWQYHRGFNPYIHVKGTLGIGAHVARRVPQENTYDGKNRFNGISQGVPAGSASGLLIFGETLNLISGVSFDQDDSTIRHFADQARKIKINPGPQFFCRLGNTIDGLFTCRDFLDLYYDLLVKGKDYVAKHGKILSHNTALVSHTLGLNYSYQFAKQARVRLGSTYVFAGRNAPRAFGVDVTFNIEF